jgi:hypothetical protein
MMPAAAAPMQPRSTTKTSKSLTWLVTALNKAQASTARKMTRS